MNPPERSSNPAQVDWSGLMRLGLGVLQLNPEVFWAMSPAELRLALEGAGFLNPETRSPMDRESLASLMSAYPDQAAPNHMNEE